MQGSCGYTIPFSLGSDCAYHAHHVRPIVPLIIVAFVHRMWIGLLINFLSVQSYWSLNEVARDLEDPFVYDPNHLPLARYQVYMPLLLFCLTMHCHVNVSGRLIIVSRNHQNSILECAALNQPASIAALFC